MPKPRYQLSCQVVGKKRDRVDPEEAETMRTPHLHGLTLKFLKGRQPLVTEPKTYTFALGSIRTTISFTFPATER